MICKACGCDVHPVLEMGVTEDNGVHGRGGGFSGFVPRCPRSECGSPMEASAPRVVGETLEAGIERLENEIAKLCEITNPPEPILEQLKFAREEQARLLLVRVNRTTAQKPKPTQIVVPAAPQQVAPHAPAIPIDDFFEAARARLAQIEAEARKLRAVLAIADQTF